MVDVNFAFNAKPFLQTLAVHFDLSSAFNSFKHKHLIGIFEDLWLPPCFGQFYTALLNDQWFWVRYWSHFSQSAQESCGLPQDTESSPVLFLISMQALLGHVLPYTNKHDTSIAMFADGIAGWTSGRDIATIEKMAFLITYSYGYILTTWSSPPNMGNVNPSYSLIIIKINHHLWWWCFNWWNSPFIRSYFGCTTCKKWTYLKTIASRFTMNMAISMCSKQLCLTITTLTLKYVHGTHSKCAETCSSSVVPLYVKIKPNAKQSIVTNPWSTALEQNTRSTSRSKCPSNRYLFQNHYHISRREVPPPCSRWSTISTCPLHFHHLDWKENLATLLWHYFGSGGFWSMSEWGYTLTRRTNFNGQSTSVGVHNSSSNLDCF